jgi:hypothetical protein
VQRAQVTVTQPLHGQFIVHADREPLRFSNLEEAFSTAEALADETARNLARQAGAASVVVRITRDENFIHHDVDGDLFLETKVIATATGRPSLSEIPPRGQ